MKSVNNYIIYPWFVVNISSDALIQIAFKKVS